MGEDVAAMLERLRELAARGQGGADALAAQVQTWGDQGVRLANAVTGAVAGANYGARTGAAVPARGAGNPLMVPALLVGAYLLLRRR